MQEKGSVPAIRFAGFTDDWEQRKFSEISIRESAIGVSTPENPCVEYEDVVTEEGRLNKNVRMKEVQKAGIIFNGTQVLYGKLRPYLHNWLNPDFGGVAVGDWWVLKPIETDKNFLYRLIQTSLFADVANQSSGSKMPRADWSLVSNTEFMIPKSLDEQSKIGRLFTHLDHLITLHQRKYSRLCNIKKSMLERMFPREGATVPEIRFTGFTDDWEQRKFGEIVHKYEDPVATPHGGYTRLGIRSHAKGTFHSYVEKGQELETAQMHRVAAGKFIVNITFGWEHAVAITDEHDAGKLVSHRFPQFSFHENMVPEFFRYVIVDEKFRHHLWLASPGGAGRNRVLKTEEMLEYPMTYPSKEEQERIAIFFRHLDHLITLHQRELERLQNIKKACLEKMFV